MQIYVIKMKSKNLAEANQKWKLRLTKGSKVVGSNMNQKRKGGRWADHR